MKWIESRMKSWIQRLQVHGSRWWYSPLIAVLAFIDHFTIVIPTDGLLVSAVLLNPRRWVSTCFIVSVGSSLGALTLAALVEWHGLPFLLQISPGLDQTPMWAWTEGFMAEYGTLALFGVALSPFMQHPAVALAALANLPLLKIFGVVLLGRLIKYGIVCWIASHMPHLLNKLWGMRDEIKEVEDATPVGLSGVAVPGGAEATIHAATLAAEKKDRHRHSV